MDITGIKISFSKTEILYHLRNCVQRFVQDDRVSLKQVEKFECFRIPFTSDRKQDKEVTEGKAKNCETKNSRDRRPDKDC